MRVSDFLSPDDRRRWKVHPPAFESSEGMPLMVGPLPPLEHLLPPEGPYAEPRLYGVRFTLKGDLYRGPFIKVLSAVDGHYGPAVFPSVLAAVRWASAQFVPLWSEFMDIVRLTAQELAALEQPVFMDSLALGQLPEHSERPES